MLRAAGYAISQPKGSEDTSLIVISFNPPPTPRSRHYSAARERGRTSKNKKVYYLVSGWLRSAIKLISTPFFHPPRTPFPPFWRSAAPEPLMHWAINATGSAIWVIFLFYELPGLITDIYLDEKTIVDGQNLNVRFIIKAFKSIFLWVPKFTLFIQWIYFTN